MKSTKLATPGLLKIKIFKNKGHDELWTMTSPTKFYHVNQIMLQMLPCDQILVTLAFL